MCERLVIAKGSLSLPRRDSFGPPAARTRRRRTTAGKTSGLLLGGPPPASWWRDGYDGTAHGSGTAPGGYDIGSRLTRGRANVLRLSVSTTVPNDVRLNDCTTYDVRLNDSARARA